MIEPIKIGLLGFGTVGSGVANVLARNAEEITRRAGRDIKIVAASVRHLDRANPHNIRLVLDPQQIVDDPDIDVIIEIMGGYDPAYALVMRALEKGKHVITANKALIATHGNDIFAAAQKAGLMVAFEAAVAGGIPIIKAIREGLAGNRIEWLAGIINGTGNFILTEMRDKGRDFAEVLGEAQALGYAEADPTFDVEGIDAAHKLTILAAIAFGIPLQFDKAYTEGITGITREDVSYAEALGYRIKHLGIARRTVHGIELRVHPTLIPEKRLIANVNGVMNAVLVHGDAVGSTLYYGPGAGSDPTASSVVADLVDVVRALTADPENRVPHLAFQPGQLADTPILPMSEIETAYYLRMRASDQPGVMADITRVLANHSISIEAIIQKEPLSTGLADIIMLTHKTKECHMNEVLTELEALSGLSGQVTRIRMETLAG